MTTNRLPYPPDDDSGPLDPMQWAEFESCLTDYAAGRLHDPAQARFEEALLVNPEWAHWVAAERVLREGIRELAQTEPTLFDPTGKS